MRSKIKIEILNRINHIKTKSIVYQNKMHLLIKEDIQTIINNKQYIRFPWK